MYIPPDIIINKALPPEDLKILEESEASETILFEKESLFHTIKVFENKFGRFLKFDDACQAGKINHYLYKGNLPHINYFLLPVLLNPDIRNVLILGLGTGNLAHSFCELIPAIENIDIVEIDPDVVEVAREYFDFRQNDKMNLHIQDARVFIRNADNKYDLVILDLFSDDGMSYRFMTEEFLSEASCILSPDGIIATNFFGLPDVDSELNIIFKSMLKTYSSVFNDVLFVPARYGNYELYKILYELKYDTDNLTNIFIFASKRKFICEYDEIIKKAATLAENTNSVAANKIDMYARDIFREEINLENVRILKDEYEHDSGFNLENLENFLLIDHGVNVHMDKINPVDDERVRLNSE